MNTHDRAAIISVGDELILGQTLDTNSKWISERLSERNVRVVEHVTVADDLAEQTAVITRLAARVPLVIVTGGLGPTADDLTRQALAAAMNDTLITDEPALRSIEALFTSRGRPVTDLQRSQALRPSRGGTIANPHGTAPGLHGVVRSGAGTCDVYCLPGPPNEMKPMLLERVIPSLRQPEGVAVRTHVLHTLGMGEGDLAQKLGPLMDRARNPLVGTTASGGVVSIRVRFEGSDADAERATRETVTACRAAAGEYVFGEGDDTIMSATLEELREHSARLVVVESCTGGLLGSLLTSVPGSSDVFLGGWITYANEMKRSQVGVPEQTLVHYGAVSAEAAHAMVVGALRAPIGVDATHAVSITGVAGPDGGSDAKPVGTVFIAVGSRPSAASGQPAAEPLVEVRRFRFGGDRATIRDRAAKMALAMLRFHLRGEHVARLLWETQAPNAPA
jgi:nicotinamide-nucleotide amidase